MPGLRRSREPESDDDDLDTLTRRRRRNTSGSAQAIYGKPSADHQPGAIVRVRLINFVTYNDAEFFPGPSLNMVIGPNGNGKSTLVCAICLGLGWGSQHLGRAKDVGDFVKNGFDRGIIEIELKKDGVKYKENPIIKATIKREGSQMTFMLNGKQSTKKACQNVAKSFTIQVDNLCQFLPQDRVVEFAALSPVELLKSTERAIASEEMIEWHDELTEHTKNLKSVQNHGKSDAQELKDLENRQRLAEADVQRLRERETIKKKIGYLETCRPLIQCRIARDEYNAASEAYQESRAELVELCEREAPALRAVNAKEDYVHAIRAVKDARTRKNVAAEQDAKAKHQAIASCRTRFEGVQKRYEERSTKWHQARQEVKRQQGLITNLQKELERGDPGVDIAARTAEARELARQRMIVKEEAEAVKARSTEMNQQMIGKRSEIDKLETELKNLDSQAGRQDQILKQKNYDTWKGWQWVQENQDKFRQPILGPPIVTCSLASPDGKIADMVESMIQPSSMFMFTAQNEPDQKLLHKYLKDDLRLRSISTRTAVSMARFRSPLSDDEVKQLGFVGFAKDYVKGPEGVVAMLCETDRLHSSALCLHKQSLEEYQNAEQSKLTGWAANDNIYRLTKRAEYGAAGTSTTVRRMRKAQFWTDQPIDASIKTEIQSKIDDLKQDVEVIREQFEENNKKVVELGNKYRDLNNREIATTKEKTEMAKRQLRFTGLPTRIAGTEETLKEAQQEIQHWRSVMEQTNDEGDAILLEKAQAAIDYADAALALQTSMASLQEVEIILIEGESDLATLMQDNIATKQRIEDKKAEAKQFDEKKKKAKEARKRLQTVVQTINREADTELHAFILAFDYENKSLEDHEIEVQTERDRLELFHDGNANAVKQFEDREVKIAALSKKVETNQRAQDELSEKITEIRGKWEPKLDKLIRQISSSFSHNMGKINCNGEVRIDKHEDFDQWCIEIQVRFREGEELTRLDSHRQSGGERAVSTIFYLMSLQTLTKSPFRVVDEINQGMDPRNERLVHSRMVAIATGNDDWQPEEDNDIDDVIRQVDVDLAATNKTGGSQYFLITPKLLHDLRYEPGMKVLIIGSGEHLDNGHEPGNKISLGNTLRAYQNLAQPRAIAAR